MPDGPQPRPADPASADLTDPDGAPLSRRARREAERRLAREQQLRLEADEVAAGTAGTATGDRSGTSTTAHASVVVDDAGETASGDRPTTVAAAAVPAAEAVTEPPHEVASGENIDPPPPAPKGGRNVPAAIGVGLLLGAIVVASLFAWRKEVFLGFAVLVCGVALWELSRALLVRDVRLPLIPLLVGAVGVIVSAYTSGVEALLVAFLLTSGGAFVWRVLDGGGVSALRDATAGVFAAAYVPFLGGFLALMLAAEDGPWRVLVLIAVCVANDTGGYAAGYRFGRHPMAPVVSPKKSWEGLAGSVLAACAVAVPMTVLLLGAPWWGGVLIAVAGVAASTLGDLAESLLKRDLGVKDMGTLLPGHGGVLDRVDSILAAAPVVYVVLYVLLGSGR